MYIGIDGNEANTNQRVGVNQYAFELLWAMYRRNKVTGFPHSYTIYLKNSPIKHMPETNSHWKYKILPGKELWVLSKWMPAIALDKNIDVLFSPHHYLPIFSIAPKVMAVHDLGYLKFSEQFRKKDFWQLKLWTAISIYVSKCIITFSKFTKNDIVRHYKINRNKINVIHHGYNKDVFKNKIHQDVVRRIKRIYNTGENYILFLGTLKPSKNIERLIEAYGKIRKSYPDYRLVISGKKGWLYDAIYQKVESLKLKEHIVFTDFVSEDDKPALIAGAKLFALPSLWEGFGMDIITANACGVPVVGGNVASIPEIGGKPLVLCDPYSVDSIAHSIIKVLKLNSREYNNLSKMCLKHAEKFSWDIAANQTISVFEKIVI